MSFFLFYKYLYKKYSNFFNIDFFMKKQQKIYFSFNKENIKIPC